MLSLVYGTGQVTIYLWVGQQSEKNGNELSKIKWLKVNGKIPMGRRKVRKWSVTSVRGLVRFLSPGLRQTAAHTSHFPSGACVKEQ